MAYDDGALEAYQEKYLQEQSENPAAPAAVRQVSGAAASGSLQGSTLEQVVAEQGYSSVTQPSWYSGANLQGTENGWDTAFTKEFLSQYDQAAADGTLATMFESPNATGVVLWDHASEDGTKQFEFGDVYQSGKKVGSVFEQFDPDTANLMLLPWLAEPEQQRDLFASADAPAAVDAFVADARQTNNSVIPQAAGSAEFQKLIDERAASWQGPDSNVDEAIIGGTTLAGAATLGTAGAVIGSVVPVIGTAVGGVGGAIIGGAIGFFGGVTNEDEIVEQAARAYEITSLANEEGGLSKALPIGVQQWSQVAQTFTTPFTQASHGLHELRGQNEIGDGQSAYYAVDDKGDTERAFWAKPLSLASMVLDGAMSFISPFNKAVYTTQMGGVIGGETTALVTGGGELFDPRSGSFDNIFTDDEGNADPVSGIAGIMKIGVDAVQLTAFRGLSAQSAAMRGTAQAGARPVEMAGFRYSFDEVGDVAGRRWTTALLAPSELVAAGSVARKARLSAMDRTMRTGEKYVVTYDDYYRAAQAMYSGTPKIKQALMNGVGESSEEFVQAILEPVSMDGELVASQVIDQAQAGFAGGVGMSLGSTFIAPSQAQRTEDRARYLHTFRNGGVEYSDEEWAQIWGTASEDERMLMSTRTESDITHSKDALERLLDTQAGVLVASDQDAAAVMDMRREAILKQNKTGTVRTDRFLVISSLLSTPRVDSRGRQVTEGPSAEAFESSAATVALLFEDKMRGLGLQLDTARNELKNKSKEIKGTKDPVPALVEQGRQLEEMVTDLELIIEVGADLNNQLVDLLEEATASREAGDVVGVSDSVRAMNTLIKGWYDGKPLELAPVADQNLSSSEIAYAMRRYATMLHSREPKLDTGSFVALLPRVSDRLTRDGADNELLVNTDILQAINGDFDGDKLRAEYQLLLGRQAFARARSGEHFTQAGTELDLGVEFADKKMAEAFAEALAPGSPKLVRKAAENVSKNLRKAIAARYGDIMSASDLDAVFTEFDKALKDGAPKPRMILMNALYSRAGGAITERGRDQLTNEWLEVSWIIRSNFQGFQRSFRQLRWKPKFDGPAVPATDQIETPTGVQKRKSAAVNDAQTLSLFVPGDSLFRKVQAIHFTFYNTKVLGAAGVEPFDIAALVELYAELSRNVTASELELVEADNSIEGKVMAQLARVVDAAMSDSDLRGVFSPQAAMTLLANMKVKDIYQDGDGSWTYDSSDKGDITLAQMLMKRALEEERSEHSADWGQNPALQAKHNKLRPMTIPNKVNDQQNAEMAFFTVFQDVPFGDLLGQNQAFNTLPPNLTMRQWLANYVVKADTERAYDEKLVTGVPEYLSREERTNIPYSLSEMKRREISTYRSVVDVLLAVGRSEQTYNPEKGQTDPRKAFGGRRSKVSHRTMDQLLEVFTLVREAAQAYRQQTNRTSADRLEGAELIQDLFNKYPKVARSFWSQFPQELQPHLFYEDEAGQLYASKWVYEMFTEETSEKALMSLFRNLLWTEWEHTLRLVHEDDGKVPGRTYRKLTSRMQRLMYRMASERSGVHMEQFVRQLDPNNGIQNIDAFFLWLNEAPGFRRSNEAAFLPFYDEVSDFEADQAGAWAGEHRGAKMREAIAELRTSVSQLTDGVALREAQQSSDAPIRRRITEQFAEHQKNPRADMPPELEDFSKLLQRAKDLPRTLSPSMYFQFTLDALHGLAARSHAKGTASATAAPLGNAQAQIDDFGYLPNRERFLEDLTAYDIDSLAGNLTELANTSGEARDPSGRLIQWEELTLESAIAMLNNPDTAPLLYRMLAPVAMERVSASESVVEKTYTQPALKDLLSNQMYKDLFNLEGDGALNRAIRYIVLLDARARELGGRFSALRYVNELVIARTSGLDKPLSDPSVNPVMMVAQAYIDTARALQLIGAIQATPQLANSQMMEVVRRTIPKAMRQKMMRQLGERYSDQDAPVEFIDAWTQNVAQMMLNEQKEKLDELAPLDTDSPAELTAKAKRMQAINKQYAVNIARINTMFDDDPVRSTYKKFELTGDPVADRAVQENLRAFALGKPSFPRRAHESADEWAALVAEEENAQPLPKNFNWEKLSRSVMGLYFADAVLRVSSHISMPMFEEGDPWAENPAQYFKFFQPYYTYLASDLLDDEALGAAAVWMHGVGDQPISLIKGADEIAAEFDRTVGSTMSLGPYTPGIRDQQIDQAQRLDSAGTSPGTKQVGNGPNRNAGIAGASLRAGSIVPPADRLTTVTVEASRLMGTANRYDPIEDVVPAGGTEPVDMPVAMLDNRYYSQIVIDGEVVRFAPPTKAEIAAGADARDPGKYNLGYVYSEEDENKPSGYRYVSLHRMRLAIERIAQRDKKRIEDMVLELTFFHPSSAPAGAEWRNNVYFDGMSHDLAPDGAPSLIASLWHDNGGETGTAATVFMDTIKTGTEALRAHRRLSRKARTDVGMGWAVYQDLADLVGRKTELWMHYDDGTGPFPPAYYNAVYKTVMMHHLVVGRDDQGKPKAMRAEEVIAFQRENGSMAPLPLTDARLVVLTPEMLRSVVGEYDAQGLPRYLPGDYLLNTSLISPYTTVSDEALRRFADGWLAEPGGLGDTSLVNVGFTTQLSTSAVLTPKEREGRNQRILVLNDRYRRVSEERYKRLREIKSAGDSYRAVLDEASTDVNAELASYVIPGIPVASRSTLETFHSQKIVQYLRGKLELENELSRGYIMADRGAPDHPQGQLTMESIDDDIDLMHQPARYDIVLLKLSTFMKNDRSMTETYKRIDRAIDYLVSTGAYVVVAEGDGGGDLRTHAESRLRELHYDGVALSRHTFEPVEFSEKTQNVRAYESTFTESRVLHTARTSVILQATDPIDGLTEGTQVPNPRSIKMRDSILLRNLLNTGQYAHYNMPFDDNRGRQALYGRALMHLRTMTDPLNTEARTALLEMSGPDAPGTDFAAALDRFHTRISSRASLVPEVDDEWEAGEIVPLINRHGHIILLRTGMKGPDPEKLRDLQSVGGMNIAVAKSEVDTLSTASSGRIISSEPRAGYGRELSLELPLQLYGDKKQNTGGFKAINAPGTEELDAILRTRVFPNGLEFDAVRDSESVDAKQALEGRVDNYRSLLAFFQYDFLPDMTEFFFPDSDPQDPANQVAVFTALKKLSENSEFDIPVTAAADIARAPEIAAEYLRAFATVEAAFGERAIDTDWIDRLADDDLTATDQIATSVIMYLATKGSDISLIMSNSGFSHPEAGSQKTRIREVPGVFADLLSAYGIRSPLHRELISRANRQFSRGPNGEGVIMLPNFRVRVTSGPGGPPPVEAWLKYEQSVSAGANPETDGIAYAPATPSGVSESNAMVASMALGAITATKPIEQIPVSVAQIVSDDDSNLSRAGVTEGAWRRMVSLQDRGLAPVRFETARELMRRKFAREEIVGLYHQLNRENWTSGTNTFDVRVDSLLSELGLHGGPELRGMAEMWVRSWYGRPYELDENGNERGVITETDAIEAVSKMLNNVREGRLPLAGEAQIPMMDVNHLTMIYMANEPLTDEEAWAPWDSNDGTIRSRTWDGFVEHAFGTAFIMKADYKADGPEPMFDSMYRLAVDGLVHGYQGATDSTRDLMVSTDILRARALMDPVDDEKLLSLNDAFPVSVDPDINRNVTQLMLFNLQEAGLDQIIVGDRIYGTSRGTPDPAGGQGKQKWRTQNWRADNEMPHPKRRTMRGVREGGQTFIRHSATTSRMWDMAINARVGNTMLNASLIFAAPVEAAVRHQQRFIAKSLQGEGTGPIARGQARLADMVADTKIGAVAEQFGVLPAQTYAERKAANALITELARHPEFRAMIYKSLMYQYPSAPGIGKVAKWLEQYAQFGARLQDPTWGMPPKSLARIYVDKLLTQMAYQGDTGNVYSLETALAELRSDPTWLQRNDPRIHETAIADIADVRSLKPTVLSKALGGVIEPLSSTSNGFAMNSAGNFIKMLTIFQNFWANSFINMTGTNGVEAWVAFWLDGNRKSHLIRRMQAAIGGDAFDEAEDEFYDMSDVIESVDLADSFIRGGITHQALFTLGMFANGLGLDGEDDEEKYRRRQAELQGAAFILDPTAIHNNYLNRDAIFLDWLPWGMDNIFKENPEDPDSRAMVQMNWISRYFLSPIIGFERFYNTGDFTNVISGFQDALGSHPLVNSTLWNETQETVAMMHRNANEAVENGRPEEGGNILIAAVGMMEKMLLENAMVNMIYIGRDEYDRDPFVLVRRNSEGEMQMDVKNNPYETDALRDYRADAPPGELGEIRQGYIPASPSQAALGQLTENRFSLALLGSIWSGVTGGSFSDSGLWRSDMAPKTRKVPLLPADMDLTTSKMLQAFVGEGGQVSLTESEAAQIIKAQYEAAGVWWDAAEVEKKAKAMSAASGMAAATMIDESGKTLLTTEGGRYIFEGLRAGTLTLGEAKMNGVYLTEEMRDQIRDDLARELMREGMVAYGLTKEQATWRMRRIMFGTGTEGDTPTMIDLLYSDQIPWNQTVEYNQLNTSYVIGPAGWPMATGFQRDGVLGAIGLKPFIKPIPAEGTGLGKDSMGMSTDSVVGINTGMRGLEARPDSWEIPTIGEEIREAAKEIVDAIADLEFDSSTPYKAAAGGGGFGGFYGGGGGYSSGGGSTYFTRMYPLPGGQVPYGNSTPFINTSNPLLRRATLRRERVWSERGRLKQWQ